MMRSDSNNSAFAGMNKRSSPRSGVRRLLDRLIRIAGEPAAARRGQLLLESLEKRQMLAGDSDLLFTEGAGPIDTSVSAAETFDALPSSTLAEGQPAPDLVQFAKDLTAAGVDFFGAGWCPACKIQKELFEDGKDYLPFIEVTNPDRTLNATGIAEGITEFPTWKFGNGTVVKGVQTLAQLSALSGVAIPQSEQPTFKPIGNQTVRIGSPLHIPIDAYDPDGGPLTVTVSVDNPSLVQSTVLSENRSLEIDVNGWGKMVFELFEQRAPAPTSRIIELVGDKFYDDDPLTSVFDGIIFHRVADDFVLQAGDPTGTGAGGSDLGDFDDQFHPDLQHNRSGILSYAKTTDDTNDSQFFITETATRHLDFNHSIFGQLVEGDDVREAISETEVADPNSDPPDHTPVVDVQINSAKIFTDLENSVVMLKALGNTPGTTNVTFTVTDQDNNTHSETIQVTVVADTATTVANSENSQPFLNPITTPAVTTTNSVAQLQLSSIDIEGDPVTYFASSQSSSANGSVSVNPTSGVVSVTPANDFVGTINVLVGVRRAQPNAFQTSDQDTQTVSFLFEGEAVVATPTSVDLQTASDTGTSNIDNITNAGSLSFTVNGVTSGATVELVNTNSGSVIGTGNATGTTIVITTNNIAALGDGTYPIAARQRVGSEVSQVSPSLTVVYDATAPASVIASATTSGNLGRAYTTDLISTEEGSGLVYALTTSPTGATINAGTGQIAWTPTSSQQGDNTFTLELTDAAGNKRTESFTVAIAGEPLAEIRLELTDLQGNAITSIAVGQQFLMNMVAVDARLFTQPGVFAAYADILFDSSIVRVVPGSSIEFSDDFTVERKGTFSTGLIDELGGVSNVLNATNVSENLIATVRMEALASGTVNIRSEEADESDSDVLLFFEDNRIPAESVFYGNASLAVGQSFTVGADTVTVAEDSGATTINVLANDQVISGNGTLSVVSVTQPTSGGTVALSNGVVRFTPTANFNGTSVFTYRVSDSGGIQENGTVTVTVTSVNDAPTAVDDTFNVDQNSSANTLDLLGNDSIAPDTGESLIITAVGTTSNGGTVSISGNGQSVLYTPSAGFTGTETFTYTMSDGGLTDTGIVTVTVAPADDPPTAVADSFDLTEDALQASFNVTSNDTRDADNQAFTISTLGTPSNGGTVSISTDGLQILYRPAANFAGSETVTYTIRDTGGGLAVGTVTFNVANVNDAPPIENPSVTRTRGSGETSVYKLSDLPDNPDANETLTFTNVATTTTAGGTVRVDTATQSIFYTPPSSTFTGSDSFTFTVSDGSALTSTGTISINVADFTERDITLNLSSMAFASRIGGIVLNGTNLLGETVSVPLTYEAESALFDNVLPGDYMIEIPAIPFLQNGSQPIQISVTSAAADGDTSVDTDMGRIRPEFLSIRDWLGSAPARNLLVAVSPGASSSLTIPSPTSTEVVKDTTVELNTAGDTLTVRGTRIADDSTESAGEATLPTANDARVQLRGEIDGLRLYKISVQDTDTFTAASITTASVSEGEAVSALTAPNTLTLGDIQAEGESPAAGATSRADLFVPVDNDSASRSDATVLSLAEGDLWVGSVAPNKDSQDPDSQDPDSQDKVSQDVDIQSSADPASVDTAMRSITELSVESSETDIIAGESSLDQELVDQAINASVGE